MRMGRLLIEVIQDSVMDSAKLIPFLFLAYLAMECLEHRAGAGARSLIRRAGRFGPVVGGLLGLVPQCGLSAAASNLYAGRVVTLGTLLAVYLSTSDEMLPILLSEHAPASLIWEMLLVKAAVGVTAGLAVDLVMRLSGKEARGDIRDICEQEHCRCEEGIVRSALSHTLQIALFVLLVNFALNLLLCFTGEDALRSLILSHPLLGSALSGLVGLIPNCAGSVVITRLYLEEAMGIGAASAGLLAASGVGLLVLFRVNHDRKENLRILLLLYGISVAAGILIEKISVPAMT